MRFDPSESVAIVKASPLWVWTNARQRKLRGSFGQMLQRLALHLDEGLLPCGMHDFQDKFAAIGRDEKKVIVVFAGKRLGGYIEAENFRSPAEWLPIR